MTIPTLANTRFGYDWLDGVPGKVAFSANGVVTGVGGKVFTLADTVGLGVKTQFAIPIMLEAEKRICLDGSDVGIIDGTRICTTFGEAAALSDDITVFTRPTDNRRFVIIGRGDYQYQPSIGANYVKLTSNSASSINLFRGARQYQTAAGNIGPTLNSAFQGRTPGETTI